MEFDYQFSTKKIEKNMCFIYFFKAEFEGLGADTDTSIGETKYLSQYKADVFLS